MSCAFYHNSKKPEFLHEPGSPSCTGSPHRDNREPPRLSTEVCLPGERWHQARRASRSPAWRPMCEIWALHSLQTSQSPVGNLVLPVAGQALPQGPVSPKPWAEEPEVRAAGGERPLDRSLTRQHALPVASSWKQGVEDRPAQAGLANSAFPGS